MSSFFPNFCPVTDQCLPLGDKATDSDILFTVKVENSSQFFGKLIVSDIKPNGSNPVKIDRYFYIQFKSPAVIGNSDVNTITNPWVDVKPDISSEQLDATTFLVKVELDFHGPYTFKGVEVITFYVNGNLDNDPHQFTQTFTLSTNQIV